MYLINCVIRDYGTKSHSKMLQINVCEIDHCFAVLNKKRFSVITKGRIRQVSLNANHDPFNNYVSSSEILL